MQTFRHTQSRWLLAPLIGAGLLLLAGCETAGESYSTDDGGYATAAGYTAPPGYASGQPEYINGQWVYPNTSPQPAYAQAGYATPAYGNGPGDYVYYPSAGVYYSPMAGQYIYRDGGEWAEHHHPPAFLDLRGPSVHVQLRGGPERDDGRVRQMYPRDWGRRGGFRHEDRDDRDER